MKIYKIKTIISKFRGVYQKARLKVLLSSRGINVTPGNWSIGFDDLLILEKEIKRYEQHSTINILEIGSGFSTVAIISILKRYFSDFLLISVEADKDWANKVQQWIAGVKDKNHGNFNLAQSRIKCNTPMI